MQKPVKKQSQKGVGLIEVILALLVFAICSLSMGNLTVTSISSSTTAEMHGTVNNLAYEMLELLKADRVRAVNNGYDIKFEELVPPAADIGIVSNLVVEWRSRVETGLPDGAGEIECDTSGCLVSLRWREVALNGENTQTFNLRASLQ